MIVPWITSKWYRSRGRRTRGVGRETGEAFGRCVPFDARFTNHHLSRVQALENGDATISSSDTIGSWLRSTCRGRQIGALDQPRSKVHFHGAQLAEGMTEYSSSVLMKKRGPGGDHEVPSGRTTVRQGIYSSFIDRTNRDEIRQQPRTSYKESTGNRAHRSVF